MRRGGITSASDRRVSSDEQPSRTNGGPDGRSAKPKRAKRRVFDRERLSSAIRFPQIVCGSIPLCVARVGVPARVPRGEARRTKASSRAVLGGSFDSAPGHQNSKPLILNGSGAFCFMAHLANPLVWYTKQVHSDASQTCNRLSSTTQPILHGPALQAPDSPRNP
jgi:hypothetical protein